MNKYPQFKSDKEARAFFHEMLDVMIDVDIELHLTKRHTFIECQNKLFEKAKEIIESDVNPIRLAYKIAIAGNGLDTLVVNMKDAAEDKIGDAFGQIIMNYYSLMDYARFKTELAKQTREDI